MLGELCRDEYGLAEVNAPASRCTITSRCMAAEPERVCSVLTINQVLLLGHKLHVGLGKTYFKKLYLPKIISRNKPKPFFFISKTHLCKQNTLQIVKQKAGESLSIPFPPLTNTTNTSTGQWGGKSAPQVSAVSGCCDRVPACCPQKRPCHHKQERRTPWDATASQLSHAACGTFSKRHQTRGRRRNRRHREQRGS